MTDALVPGDPGLPAAVVNWARELVARLAREPLFQHTAVFVYEARRDALVLAGQAWGPVEDVGAIRVGAWVVPLEGSICGRVFHTGQATLIADIRADPDYRGFPGGRTRSELCVPIVASGRSVGVVNLESPRVGVFEIADHDRVRTVADEAGLRFAELGLSALLGGGPRGRS